MQFTAGQPLDAATMNELASYPKMMELHMINSPGSGSARSDAVCRISSIAGEIFGTLINNNQIELGPGRYYLDVPLRHYRGSTGYYSVRNDTDNLEVRRTYSWSNSSDDMNNCILKASIIVPEGQTKIFSIRNLNTHSTYPSIGSITMLGPN